MKSKPNDDKARITELERKVTALIAHAEATEDKHRVETSRMMLCLQKVTAQRNALQTELDIVRNKVAGKQQRLMALPAPPDIVQDAFDRGVVEAYENGKLEALERIVESVWNQMRGPMTFVYTNIITALLFAQIEDIIASELANPHKCASTEGMALGGLVYVKRFLLELAKTTGKEPKRYEREP